MSEVIVTKQNFATMLNLGNISKSSFNAFNKEIGSYAKEINEMIIRENQDNTSRETLEATSEFLGVGVDVGKVLVNKTINEGLTQNISFKISDTEQAKSNKERVGKFWNNENNVQGNSFRENRPDEFLRNKVENIVKENEQLLRAEKVFTDKEFNKIFSDGSGNIPKMLDLDLGAGTATDMEVDINILDKCSSCMLKKDGEYIFKDFLIIDGNGQAVDPKLINNVTGKFILNFGLQGDIAKQNTEAIKTIKAVANYRDRVKKFSKLRGNGNLLKLLKRGTGIDTIKKEFDEYLQPLRQVRSVKRVAGKMINIGEGTVKIGYKAVKGVDIGLINRRYKSAKELKDVKKSLKLYKDLKIKKNSYKSFEKKVTTIRHPIKALTGRIAERIKSTKTVRNLLERAKKSRLLNGLNGLRDGIGRVLSMPFKLVGKVVTPVVLIIKQIIVSTLMIMLPFILILIILMAIVGGIGGAVSSNVAAVIPLGNQSDYERWQKEYDTLDDNFLNSLEYYLADYAMQKNLKGEKIFYGVNGQNNEEGMENEDFVNGIYYKFITDEKNEGRSSNIEDLICIMAIMMSQAQADYKEEASKVLEWLYDISHTYTYTESVLYACDSGCHKIHYECNDHYHNYSDTDIKYSPFHALRKHGDEYEIKKSENYCVVCEQKFKRNINNTSCVISDIQKPSEEDYWGCVSHNNCFHGNDGNMGRSYSSPYSCNNHSAVYDCPGHTSTDSNGNSHTSYCPGPLGCQGYYQCEGHEHFSCDGHEYKCCMGHTDIQMNVEIKFYDDIKEIINKYNFGNGDNV